MNKLLTIFIGILMMLSCKNKDTKVVYVDRDIPIDSNTVFIIDVDKNGSVTDTYVNEKYFNNENIELAKNSLNDSCFYEYTTANGVKEKTRVFKHEYVKDNYLIDINNDSLFVGETFMAFIHLDSDEIKYSVDDREQFVIEEKKINSKRYVTISKVLNSEGVNSLSGKLIINNTTIPFLYRYKVLFK